MTNDIETLDDFIARLSSADQEKIRAGSKIIQSKIRQERAKLRAKKVNNPSSNR